MKWSIAAIVSASGLVAASPLLTDRQDHGSGSGPYPASWFTDPSLINHTIYMPLQPTRGESLPVLLWSEGGCANDGKAFVEFLTNIASYGFIVLANGPPGGAGSTTAQYVKDAAQWISAKAGTCGRYHHVDADRMAAAGQSCGGLETYQMRDEENIRTLGIFNSGFVPGDRGPLPNDTIVEGPDTIKKVHKPVFYFLGGSTDVAYPNGEADYHNLTGVPKWIGNYNVGHGGTYNEKNGGAFGTAAVRWLQWTLKRNTTAAGFFTAGGAEAGGWSETESSDLGRVLDY